MYQTSIGAHHHRSGRGVEKIRLPEGVTPVPALFQKAGYFTCIGSGLPGESRRGNKAAQGGGLGKTDYNFEYEAAMFDSHDWAGRKSDQPFFMQVQLAGGKLRGGTNASAIKLLEAAAKEFGAATVPRRSRCRLTTRATPCCGIGRRSRCRAFDGLHVGRSSPFGTGRAAGEH
jgi:hypothetical protein